MPSGTIVVGERGYAGRTVELAGYLNLGWFAKGSYGTAVGDMVVVDRYLRGSRQISKRRRGEENVNKSFLDF